MGNVGIPMYSYKWTSGDIEPRIEFINKFFICNDSGVIDSGDDLSSYLINNGWSLKLFRYEDKFDVYHSEMNGFSSGRFRLELKTLKRKNKGKKHHVKIYFTPYNPNYLKVNYRFNNLSELKNLIGMANEKLLINKTIRDEK